MAKDFSRKFYNSKAWKFKRAEILHRDLYTCADCACRATEVHHIIELTPDNINDITITLGNNNLISLCHDCHKKYTLNSQHCDVEYTFNKDGFIVPKVYLS